MFITDSEKKTMQTFINKSSLTKNHSPSFIMELVPAALSNIPFHSNTESITRYVAEHFPVHLAVHEVSPITVPPEEYTQLHQHDEFDEINILLSKESLQYNMQLGTDVYTVNSNTAVWIPRGTLHAANVLKGSGYFITLRLH